MKKHPSLRMPGRWFGARRDAVFDPLKPGVPPIVEGPISYLEKNGVNTEGLFRTAGSAATSRVIKARFDKGKPVDLSNLDVHTVAGVVTLFFNKLPNPLLTTELYDCFITAVEVPDEETRLECIRQCLELLPPGNKAVLARLVGFLKVVAENKAITKMDSRNLAIVFAPTILRPPEAPEGEENSIAALLGDSLLAHKLMEAFIKNYDDLLGTNKPVCRLKIRHSLTPVQQAAFFRTIKRGTIKLAEAMLTYDGIGSPMPPPPPPPPPPLVLLAQPSSADTKNKKEKRTRSRKEKANKKERKSSISRSGGGRGGAPTATPPTPTSPFPGVPLHTASRPLDALPEVGCGNPRRMLTSQDEEYWFGPYSGSDSEEETYELDANAAIAPPHSSEGDGAHNSNNNAGRRQAKKARRKGAMLSTSGGLIHAGESVAQHPPSELLTASMPQSARSSARHIGGDTDDDSADDNNNDDAAAALDRVVANPLLALPGWSEGELQRKLTRKMRSGSEGVARDVRRDTRQRGNTATGGSVMLSPSPSTPGSGERRVSITTSTSAATGREKKRASHSPSAPGVGSLIALASVPPPLVSFDEPGGGSVVVLGSGGTGALLRSSVGSTPRGRSTSGSLTTPSADSIPKNRNNSNSTTSTTTSTNNNSSSSKKRISLNRINGINAMEKVSDMIRNVKERKNKNKRDSSLNGSGGSTGNPTEFKVGEAHLQAHHADTGAQPESPKDSGAAPWPVRKKTAAKLEDAVEARRRLQQQKGRGDSLGDMSSGDDSSFDPDVDGATSAGPTPIGRKPSDPIKLAAQERKRSNSDVANMPSSSSSSPSASSASSSSSLALVTASGMSLSANVNISPANRRWSRSSRTTTAQARGGGETDSCSSDQSDPSSDSASSLESGGAGADYLTAHRVMTRGHSERSTSVGSGGDEKLRLRRKMKSGVPEGGGSAAAEASTAAASASGSASGESPVLGSASVGLRLTVTGASGEFTPVREVVQGEGQGELASDVSHEHEVVTARILLSEVEIDYVDDHGDSGDNCDGEGDADDSSSDDEPPEERAASGNEWYSETLAADQRRSSEAQQKPQQDHQDRGGRPRPAGLHPLDPQGGSTSASSSPAMHRRALAHMLVSPRLNRSAPTASGDDPAARSSNFLSRARSSADTRSPKLMRRHHSKTELPTAGAHLQFAPEYSPDVSTSTSPSEARLYFPPPTDFAALATRRLSAPTRYGAGLWDDEVYDPYDDSYHHHYHLHHHGVMAWQRTAQGWRRGLTPSPSPAAAATDRHQRRRRRALMRDPSGSHTGSEICVKTSRSSPAVELLPRSFSSPALIPHGPRPKPPDAHEIAESILKGNLTDLWSKYLSTLQPNRRASTDLKIVSILKERMQSLDSDDSDDMLEYFMDMEGVDAAAAELMSARASAGLPQRRPSLSGTSSSSASPAMSSRRRTLARSNEEGTTQATTATAAAKEKTKENKEMEKEKENNDEEKGIEKEEANSDKGQQHQQRETRKRIQG